MSTAAESSESGRVPLEASPLSSPACTLASSEPAIAGEELWSSRELRSERFQSQPQRRPRPARRRARQLQSLQSPRRRIHERRPRTRLLGTGPGLQQMVCPTTLSSSLSHPLLARRAVDDDDVPDMDAAAVFSAATDFIVQVRVNCAKEGRETGGGEQEALFCATIDAQLPPGAQGTTARAGGRGAAQRFRCGAPCREVGGGGGEPAAAQLRRAQPQQVRAA